MPVYQPKAGGNQYDRNHPLRLFFYYTFDARHGKRGTAEPRVMFEDE